MPTPDEVARIKREALEDVAQWMRDSKFSQWEREAFASYRQEHYPPPAPAPSPAPARDCSCGHSFDCHAVTLGKNCTRCPCVQYAPDARPQQGAPAPAETREWWLVLSNHDLRPLCVYPTQERARRVALELLGSGCEAESLSVVPRAALNAMREERDAAGRRLQALQPVVAEVIREKDEAKAQLREATEERDRLAVAVDCALSPFGVEFMDPPDGGNVEPDEQLRRMANALVDTRAQLREATRERDYARQEAEFWNTQSKKRHGERDEARAQLAAAERELEGVRKVEAYMKRIRNRVERRDGLWFAEVSHPSTFPQYEPPTWVPDAYAPTLAALGHLLPEVPDAK